MEPFTNRLRSWVLMVCIAPLALVAAENESVDIVVGESDSEGIEREAYCGHGGNTIFDHFAGTYLPGSLHVISQVSALGDEVQLEDGSVWKVSPYDCNQAVQWLNQSVPVSVMQNTSWFSSYNFRIVNRTTGHSIIANLFQGPWKGGEKSHYVVEYDLQKGTVNLSTPAEITHWEIHPNDLHRFRAWNFTDSIPVIIGQNADYDTNWNPYWETILINVRDTKRFIRAHQY